MSKKKAPTKKAAARAAAPTADKRIAQLRKKINEALADPEFAEMSKAFRKSIEERMGVDKIGPGSVFETKLPPEDDRIPYYNIYRYRFW